ncbi:MAG: hypothetical protein U0929_03555 [Planctomycetaceae bacterium]
MIANSRSVSALMLVALTGLMSGCGGADIPELGDVRGTVKMNGEPVVGIDVVAYPQEGRPGFGLTDENGAYKIMFKNGISGTKVGQTRITPLYTSGGKPIPKEYNEMMFDIKPGENVIDFDMKSNDPAWTGAAEKPSKKPKKPLPPD